MIGSNVSDFQEGVLKLLPEDPDGAAERIKEKIFDVSGKDVEVLIFGDGAYKDLIQGSMNWLIPIQLSG